MIEVRELSRKFGEFAAVDNISFQIQKSDGITALLGPNGAGKTTTMRMLTGFLRATGGVIKVNGLDLSDEQNLVRAKASIGYLPESTPLYPEMLVSEYLAFMGRVRGLDEDTLEKRAREVIAELELESHLYSPIGILSKGFRQRVGLAATLIHDPDIIILDEPTSGLDPNQITHIRKLIKNLGQRKTLILSTHILQEVEDVCDRVIIINRGKIVADESRETLMHSASTYAIVSPTSGAREKIERLPAVKELRAIDRTLFHCEIAENSTAQFFRDLAGSGIDVLEFRPLKRSLQEIFQELTHA